MGYLPGQSNINCPKIVTKYVILCGQFNITLDTHYVTACIIIPTESVITVFCENPGDVKRNFAPGKTRNINPFRHFLSSVLHK